MLTYRQPEKNWMLEECHMVGRLVWTLGIAWLVATGRWRMNVRMDKLYVCRFRQSFSVVSCGREIEGGTHTC